MTRRAAAERSSHIATTAQASPCSPKPMLAEVTSSYARSASANATPAVQPSSGIQIRSAGVARQITTHHAKPWSGPQMAGLSGAHTLMSQTIDPATAATRAAAHPVVSAPLVTHLGTPVADQRAAAAEVRGEAKGSTKRFPRIGIARGVRPYPRRTAIPCTGR